MVNRQFGFRKEFDKGNFQQEVERAAIDQRAVRIGHGYGADLRIHINGIG